jgi:transcriptional regulator with XRE-family HTH domain
MGYRGKLAEQNRARDLRALGWTYKEICEELGVSRSSVSLWVRDVEPDRDAWVARARANYENGNFGPRPKRPHRQQLEKAAEIARFQEEGRQRIGRLTEQEFLVAGVALYAGEGAKTGHAVVFANSDPRMILFFVTWLRRFFDVEERRLRMVLYLHQGLDLGAAEVFWSKLTGIPCSQFGKPFRAVPDPSIRRAKHPMGCPRVAYSSSPTLRSILGMSDALLTCPDAIPG